MEKNLFCFGFGYCAQALAQKLAQDGFKIHATIRDDKKANSLINKGITPHSLPFNINEIPNNSYILISAAPNNEGDIFFQKYAEDLIKIKERIKWLGYLSTIAVYGDKGQEIINEATEISPNSQRAKNRVIAEKQWDSLKQYGIATNIFRLGGIYGQGRSIFDRLKDSTAKIVEDNKKLTCRIHVEDIAGVLNASLKNNDFGKTYNLIDDMPANSNDLVIYAANKMGIKNIPTERLENLSEIAKSFLVENRIVSNEKIKTELGYKFKYPNYIKGLYAIWENEKQ